MGSRWYNAACKEILSDELELSTATLKVMLVKNTYTFNADHTVVDAGGGSDPLDAELTVSGYTGGWGGSGRKTLTGKSFAVDNTNDLGSMDANDLTWTALGTGETIEAAILIKEGGSDDTTSRLIAYVDGNNIATTGADVTVQWSANGILRFKS